MHKRKREFKNKIQIVKNMPRSPEVVGVDLAMPHLWPQVLGIEEVSCKAQSRISKSMHARLWDESVRIRCE